MKSLVDAVRWGTTNTPIGTIEFSIRGTSTVIQHSLILYYSPWVIIDTRLVHVMMPQLCCHLLLPLQIVLCPWYCLRLMKCTATRCRYMMQLVLWVLIMTSWHIALVSSCLVMKSREAVWLWEMLLSSSHVMLLVLNFFLVNRRLLLVPAG